VIESNEINAFGLPGGYLYVDSGLILAADSEAELAGVVAHEVAHVAARHDARIATRNRIWKLISYCSGPAGGAVKLAGYIWSTKLRREAEREADFLGLEYQYASGYDPRAFVQFFERLHIAEDHSFIGKMFARYPLTEDRIRRAEKEISALPARDEHIVDTSEFQEVKSRLANIMLGQRKSEDGSPVLRRHGNDDSRPQVK
jgi:predicted Zn-dependent protease